MQTIKNFVKLYIEENSDKYIVEKSRIVIEDRCIYNFKAILGTVKVDISIEDNTIVDVKCFRSSPILSSLTTKDDYSLVVNMFKTLISLNPEYEHISVKNYIEDFVAVFGSKETK